MKEELRWQQRFSNYRKALKQLEKALEQGTLSELEREGMIQRFEYTFELAWNTLKDYFEFLGVADLKGGRDTILHALKVGLIDGGESWMLMFKSRNLTSHTYHEQTAIQIADAVRAVYVDLFRNLAAQLEKELAKYQ